MSLMANLIKELTTYQEKPNEFEKYLKKNAKHFDKLSDNELSRLNMMKKRSIVMCNISPYKRSEIIELIENCEIRKGTNISDLYDIFTEAEYIFERYSKK